MTGAELVGVWSNLVVDGIVKGGVREVVIAPGSRSTPFALALLRRPELRCHSIVDERSAAFFALGQARLSNTPSLVLCTSGTAGAHCFAAILEARASAVPLLVLTADRPFELHDCGAPQTTDQVPLFGQFVRRCVDLGEPVASQDALRSLHRRTLQAALATRTPIPGPVHINARVSKPLEPAVLERTEGLAVSARRIRDEGVVAQPPPPPAPSSASLAAIARDLAVAERGLIVCGALPPTQSISGIQALARHTGLPLVAEAASQVRVAAPDLALCDGIEAWLTADQAASALWPDVVLQIGAAPLAPAWAGVLRQTSRYHVLHPYSWADPSHRASSIAIGDVGQALQCLTAELDAPSSALQATRRRWSEALQTACATAWRAVKLSVAGDAHAPLSEPAVVREVAASLPSDAVLALGNSLPIRQLDRFAPAWTVPHPVVTQRGINGIDGLVSAAAGLASLRATVTLLLGDISFLHDVGGLWAASRVSGRLVIVVINNRGGRIFGQLPVAKVASVDELGFFTTPHELDLSAVAALYHLEFVRAATAAQLTDALAAAYERRGCTIVEARVAPDDTTRMAKLLQDNLVREIERGHLTGPQ